MYGLRTVAYFSVKQNRYDVIQMHVFGNFHRISLKRSNNNKKYASPICFSCIKYLAKNYLN